MDYFPEVLEREGSPRNVHWTQHSEFSMQQSGKLLRGTCCQHSERGLSLPIFMF